MRPHPRIKHRRPENNEMFGFSWLIEGALAGVGRPGVPFSNLEDDLVVLRDAGVRSLVSLTEDPLDPKVVGKFEFHVLHLPIPDMMSPTLADVERFVAFTNESIESDRPVAVHCLVGRGRTGTMLASYLVSMGKEPAEAIELVRKARPGSIETLDQEGAVFAYAQSQTELDT